MRARAAIAELARAEVVLCSACLLGFRCRYDGGEKTSPRVLQALAGKAVVPLCPEVAGGLPTPRLPADPRGGDGGAVLDGAARIVRADGADVSGPFREGARHAVEAAFRHGARVAVLKERSPSCGVRTVNVDGAPGPGMGVAAAALQRAGIAVLSDEEVPAPAGPSSEVEA